MKNIKELTRQEKKELVEQAEQTITPCKLHTALSFIRDFLKTDEKIIKELKKQLPPFISNDDEKILAMYLVKVVEENINNLDEAINLFRKLIK